MSERLKAAFPGLCTTPFRISSPSDPAYNCIAWAAGSKSDWWWPLDNSQKAYWPEQVPRERTLESFQAAFVSPGYVVCDNETLELTQEKIAIFVDSAGTPTHAARQLTTGRWTSKLGQSEDIEHDLRALEGAIYGTVALILQRP